MEGHAASFFRHLPTPNVRPKKDVLQNGKSFDREIVFENKDTLKLEIFVPPAYTIARRLEQARVKTLIRASHDGSPYVLIPILGAVGEDITADAFHAGLAQARAAKASRVILAIDSPGGDIGQMCQMVDDLAAASQDMEVVYLTKEHNQPVLRTFGPGKLIKAKDPILTLTAHEACECGLGRIATNLADLGKQLTGGRWHESTHRPWNAVVAAVEGHRQHQRDLAAARQRQVARRAAIEQIRPACEAIEQRLAELSAKAQAARHSAQELVQRGDAELAQIDAEYQQALQAAQFQPAPNAAIAQAAQAKNQRAATVRQFYESKLTALKAEFEAARTEAARLQGREKEMIASLPPE